MSESLTHPLAALASQHHASDYNRLKFGPQGCPVAYTPLSVHMPEHVSNLQARQPHLTWWPAHYTSPPTPPPILLGPSGATSIDLQHDLSAAISDPLPDLPSQLKTSDTHPINISLIIPPELLPVISFHIIPTRRPAPTLFDIPPSYSLDRLTSPHPHLSRSSMSTSVSPSPVRTQLSHLRTRSAVSDALQAAISGGLAAAVTTTVLGGLNAKPKGKLTTASKEKDTPYRVSSLANISTHKLSLFVSPLHTPRCVDTRPTIPSETTSILKQSRPHRYPRLHQQSFSLGNLLLSSCPGKKVRLSGPVKGRSGVCRDLRTDLRRMRSLGVRCIICCLDDAELEFLGAPWDEYVSAAGEIGMDVLRIPTPEGLTPQTPASLDEQLTQLIQAYTLRGTNVLVHCRGGVGRAGVVGCCWLLKLGLCGWIETGWSGGGWSSDVVRRDTLQLVERVIGVVRRRRSVKAVETYEQVKFLVEYVDYLRERGGVL